MIDSPILRLGSRALSAPVPKGRGVIGLDVPEVDRWLKGGLRRDGLHEFYAPSGSPPGPAMALALLAGMRNCGQGRSLMWLRARGGRRKDGPHAPGLAELGIDPAALLLLELADPADLLVAGVESLRHGGAGAVVLELRGRCRALDLTASRRLALAAERSGTMALIVRGDARPVPSAAHTRWQVSAAPSRALPANAPGHPVFDLQLLRQRGGAEGLHVQLEWNREQAVFRTPIYGDPPAVPAGRTEDRRARRAA